jgi:hypothetical protein
MSERVLAVSVPDWFPESMDQSILEQRTFEFVLCENLVLRFDQVRAGRSLEEMVAILNNFSDAALWQVLAYRVPYTIYLREQELVEKEHLTLQEEQELEELTKITIRLMRVRSQALLLLKQHGHDIDRYAAEQAR